VNVKKEGFDKSATLLIAAEIAEMNRKLSARKRKYILIGPGRWGSTDRWLGIPVKWPDISGVAASVECAFGDMSPDPSQGSHFFHNITTLGINYLTVESKGPSIIDWEWLSVQKIMEQTENVCHVEPEIPLTMKVDGRRAQGIIIN
ncbi:phosphoenolpyruvate synthase/pyruvate phosphate dikinase, partial [Desulfobacterales bacterium HSG17]|nr:phosphoenolpyruvate synthase/pyruvate phosphate dikinase [Desulfobacterales bacterium HSG17]